MKKLLEAAENNIEMILQAEQFIWQNPETGFREVKTNQYLADIFQIIGYALNFAGDIPGFYTTIDTGRSGPTLLILGEMDSVICPQHKSCDTNTGAVHACGHHIQCASLVGIAVALKEPWAMDDLSGKIKLCAIPAE